MASEIGPIAKPRQIMVVAELPKTRSGKIMRRLLRDVAENREVGDVTTLADSSVMDLIKTGLSTRRGLSLPGRHGAGRAALPTLAVRSGSRTPRHGAFRAALPALAVRCG